MMNINSLMMIIGIMAISTDAQHGITFTETHDTSGIIFVPIADTYLTYNEWRIVYYYDLQEYYNEIQMMNLFQKRLESICTEKIHAKSKEMAEACQITLNHAKNHLQSIDRNRQIIESYNSITKRFKRAPLNVVGSLANMLFGILDQSDAAKYDAEIQKLKKDQSFGTELLKENTLITEKTIKTVNTSFTDVNRKLKELETNIQELDNRTDATEMSTIFSMMANTLTITFVDHDQLNTEIKNILAHTLRGEITEIVPIDQLKHDLMKVQQHIDKNEELTIDVENESIYHIFKAASVHSALRGHLILMELRIPILDSEIFKLYRAIPIPTKIENDYAMIMPNSNMFLTNMARTKYVPITNEEFHDCRTIHADKYICKQYEPIFTEPENVCELTLLSKPFTKQIPKSCTIQSVPAGNYYLPLDEMNKYYCVIATPVETQILCKNHTEPFEMTKSGILEIRENCRIQTEHQTLRAHSIYRKTDTKIIAPKFNISSLIVSETQNRRTKIDPKNIYIRDHDSGLEEIANDLNELKRKENELSINLAREAEIKTMKFSIGGMAITISVIALGTILFLLIRFQFWYTFCFKWMTTRKTKCEKDLESPTEEQEIPYERTNGRVQTPFNSRRTM